MNRQLGEREIIQTLTRIYGGRKGLPLGFEDDVAAVPTSPRRWLVLKSDMLVASTDVPPGMRLWQTARKAVVATVSDFAAKGVRPRALMVSLGVPRNFTRTQLGEIGSGLRRGAEEYKCPIVGGDTGQAADLVIDCIGAGETQPSKLVTRSGARPGDLVAVTGTFGNSAAGLRMLASKRRVNRSERITLEKAVFMPKARLREGIGLARTMSLTSSTDSSDGLAWSLHEIARNSQVALHIDRVPIAREAAHFGALMSVSPVTLALYGGEEYELVFTFKRREIGKVKKAVPSILVIGRVDRGPANVTAVAGGRSIDVERKGYEHFRS